MLIDNRVKGAVVQNIKIDQTSKNLNINYEPPKSTNEIDKELRNIQKEILALAGGPSSDALELDAAMFSTDEIKEEIIVESSRINESEET
jgi:hypothetical protein